MQKQELEMFVAQQVLLTRRTTQNKLMFYNGQIKQLYNDALIFEDKFGKMLLIPFETIEHVETQEREWIDQ